MELVIRLLHGTRMRLLEGLRLRVKDVDFAQGRIMCETARAARTG
jgi:hypothetical protein